MPLLWNVRRQCFELFQMQVNLNNYMIFCHPSCSYYQFMFCIQPICVPDVPLIVTPSVGRNIGKSIRKPANLRRLQVLFYPNHPQTIPGPLLTFTKQPCVGQLCDDAVTLEAKRLLDEMIQNPLPIPQTESIMKKISKLAGTNVQIKD